MQNLEFNLVFLVCKYYGSIILCSFHILYHFKHCYIVASLDPYSQFNLVFLVYELNSFIILCSSIYYIILNTFI